MRRSERILRQRFGIVRSAAFRSTALSLLKNCSIGLRSGEYEGKSEYRCAYCLDRFYYADYFMSGQLIHDDGIAATKSWCEALLNVREESGAVHRSIEHEWGDDPVGPQTGNKGDRFPIAVGDGCDQSLAARTAASEPHHVCASGSLVNKHQPGGIKQALLSYPTSAGGSGTRPLFPLPRP